jgi:hypothetical protein
MALAVAWGLVLVACIANAIMLRRARASRSARDALAVTGTGCGTFVVGVGVMLFVLAEASRHLAHIDDPRAPASELSSWLDLFSPPGYTALGVGFAVVCIGAWLRAGALEDPPSRT